MSIEVEPPPERGGTWKWVLLLGCALTLLALGSCAGVVAFGYRVMRQVESPSEIQTPPAEVASPSPPAGARTPPIEPAPQGPPAAEAEPQGQPAAEAEAPPAAEAVPQGQPAAEAEAPPAAEAEP